MTVEITAYGMVWNIARNQGGVRLRGSDGQTWDSPLLDASSFTAIAEVLRSGARAGGGSLFSGEEKPSTTSVEGMAVFGGENPFPW
jgi:hypothetical protein